MPITNNKRNYSPLDRLCIGLNQALRAVAGHAAISHRPYPATAPEPRLGDAERRHAAGLMRVNHAGEVAAQALYHGQARLSSNPVVQRQLQTAAVEEGDHLAWCAERLTELNSHTSYLNPLWYVGSFTIGLAAGWAGDKWSLGFVAETERQVVKHLQKHLAALPSSDIKSAQILRQMQMDEAHHRDSAIQSGAAPLPYGIKKLMSLVSKVMVKTAYWF